MFGIDTPEMMILFVVALLLFGKRLPEVARTVGKGVADFKKGLSGLNDEVYTGIHGNANPGYGSNTNSNRPAPQPRPAPIERREESNVPRFDPPQFEAPKFEPPRFDNEENPPA